MNETADIAPVTLLDLIEQLVPPQEPPAVSMVPQTWGWGVLTVVVLGLAIYFFLRWRAHYRANAYRRDALAALDAAQSDPATVAEILRRCALAAFPRKDVAGLSGQEWLGFLDHTGGNTAFTEGRGKALSYAPYTNVPPRDADLLEAARNWVRNHKREG